MDILYKSSGENLFASLSSESAKDIALHELINYMSNDSNEQAILRDIMFKIPLNPSDMIYRQEIVRDFIDNGKLYASVKESIDAIKVLDYYSGSSKRMRSNDSSLTSLLEDLRELKVYVEVVEKLYASLTENDIHSEGLKALRSELEKTVNDENFKNVKPDIEKLHDDLSNARGAIIGVTLTSDLDIDQVTAIEITDYKPRSTYSIADVAVVAIASTPFKKYKKTDPLLNSMAPYLKKHLSKHYGEIKRLIQKHSKYDSRMLTQLYNGLVFYLCAANLWNKLNRQGYTLTYPKIDPATHLNIKGLYNIRLAIKAQKNIVKNDFVFSDKEKMFILTGPNRGGKTILEQGIGFVSIMSSLGMFVTADSCTGLPFSNILSHFPIDENLTINYGRLGEEAVRIKEIVKKADDNTLILFNETFSTTSAADALYLSKDLLHILKEKGSSVIFNTHIHELASDIPEMNSWNGESNIISLVMEIKDNKNTFKVKRSEPDTSSYAKNIAEKYGITYEQMKSIRAGLS